MASTEFSELLRPVRQFLFSFRIGSSTPMGLRPTMFHFVFTDVQIIRMSIISLTYTVCNCNSSKGLHTHTHTHTHYALSVCVTINNWELAEVRNRCHALIYSLACFINNKYHGFSKYSALKTQTLWQTNKSSSRRQKTHSFGRQTISNSQLINYHSAQNLRYKAAAMPYIYIYIYIFI